MDTIQMQQAELGEKNIFEEILSLLERHRLNLEEYFPLGNLYNIVNDFDNAFQKLNSSKSDENNIYLFNTLLYQTVGNFLTIFRSKGFRDEPIFYSFKRFIVFFTMVLKESSNHKNRRDIIRSFFENFPSFNIDIRNYDEDAQSLYINYYGYGMTEKQKAITKFEEKFCHEIGQLSDEEEAEKILTIYCNEFIGKKLIWDKEHSKYNVVEEVYYMIIDINIDTANKSVEKLIGPLWLLAASLEKIENVNLELEEILKGSLKTSIKVWMKDLLAKEETKAVLQTAKEAAVKTITGGQVSYSGIKKSMQETKKVELENIKLETEIKHSPTAQEIQFERALDIERKMLENEKIELENAKTKIEYIQSLSELASKGILQADMIRIDINDILFLFKEGDNIKPIGQDIDKIS